MATRKALLLALALGFVASSALAKEYTFKELAINDYTAMDKLVRKTMGANTIDDLEREPKVREALKIVFSRTNSDGKRTALYMNLQGQLPEPIFILAMKNVATGAIAILKDAKLPHITRATAYLVLENMLGEIQPRAEDYKDVLDVIKTADIEINSELRSYRRLEGMETNTSPSETASKILARAEEQKEKAKDDEKAIATNTLSDFAD